MWCVPVPLSTSANHIQSHFFTIPYHRKFGRWLAGPNSPDQSLRENQEESKKQQKKSTQKSIKVPPKQCCSGPGHTQVNKRQVRSIPRDMACARVASCLGEEWTGHWLRLHRQSVHYCCNTDRFPDMGNLFSMQFSHPTQMSWARAFDRLFTGEICVCLEV